MDSAQDSYKKWGIALIVFLLISIPVEIAFFNSAKNSKPKSQSTEISKTGPKETKDLARAHDLQFYIQIKYNPDTKTITKLGSGKVNADQDILQDSPSDDPEDFSYKLEVISSQNELLVSGWKSISKVIISDEIGNYVFRVSAPYKSGEIFRVYSIEGNKLWEETIND